MTTLAQVFGEQPSPAAVRAARRVQGARAMLAAHDRAVEGLAPIQRALADSMRDWLVTELLQAQSEALTVAL